MSKTNGKPTGHHQQEMIDVRFFGEKEIFLSLRHGQVSVPLWYAFEQVEADYDALSFVLGKKTVVSAYIRRLNGGDCKSCETLRIVAHEICDPRRDHQGAIASCMSLRLVSPNGESEIDQDEHPANLKVDSWELLTDKHRKFQKGIYSIAPRFQALKQTDWVIVSTDGLVHPVARHIPDGLEYKGDSEGVYQVRFAERRNEVYWRKFIDPVREIPCVSIKFDAPCLSPALTLNDSKLFTNEALLLQDEKSKMWWMEWPDENF